jgi:hypothetical protein
MDNIIFNVYQTSTNIMYIVPIIKSGLDGDTFFSHKKVKFTFVSTTVLTGCCVLSLLYCIVLYCIYFEFHQILVQVREQVTNHRI